MAASVASGSNLGRTTTWLPASHAAHDHTRGPLWYSGPGMTMHPSGEASIAGPSSFHSAGSPDTISLGRPVEPPEVGAFHAGDVTSGNGPSSRPGSGRYPTGSARRPPATCSPTPITAAGSARSRIAWSSRSGSLADTGCGMAPIFQQAAKATYQSVEFGSAMVT